MKAFIAGCNNGVQAPVIKRQRQIENMLHPPYVYQVVIVYNTSVQPQTYE